MTSAAPLKGSIQEVTIASRHLGTDERLMIYTPGRYSPLYKYPVLYVQDGDDYLAMGRLASILDDLIVHREIQELIAVFLPVDKRDRQARYHPEGTQHAAYLRFLAEEAVSWVDDRFASIPLGGARTLLGDSLGGVVSLFAALTYPHTFGQAACQSGAFDDAICRRAEAFSLPASLSVYLEVGTEETAVETPRGPLDLVAGNRRMKQVLEAKGVAVSFETFEGGHTWGYWQSTLPGILRHFFA